MHGFNAVDLLIFCAIGFVLGFFTHEAFGDKHFKNPYCIEKDFGTEKIKKCYKLEEVKR